MTKEKKQTTETSVEALENALTRTEQYIEANQKSLTIIVIAVVAIVGAYLGYKRLYLGPKEIEAQSQIFAAEQYFEKDSFNLALNGDGNYLGLLDIIDKYGPTRTANLANYYAGISYRELGQYEEALSYLKKFDAGDEMVTPEALGAMGDCYVELNNLTKGVKYYQKAAEYSDNDFTTPLFLKKAAEIYIELKAYDKALTNFEKIKKEYPKSTESRDADKDIARLKTLQSL